MISIFILQLHVLPDGPRPRLRHDLRDLPADLLRLHLLHRVPSAPPRIRAHGVLPHAPPQARDSVLRVGFEAEKEDRLSEMSQVHCSAKTVQNLVFSILENKVSVYYHANMLTSIHA